MAGNARLDLKISVLLPSAEKHSVTAFCRNMKSLLMLQNTSIGDRRLQGHAYLLSTNSGLSVPVLSRSRKKSPLDDRLVSFGRTKPRFDQPRVANFLGVRSAMRNERTSKSQLKTGGSLDWGNLENTSKRTPDFEIIYITPTPQNYHFGAFCYSALKEHFLILKVV